MSEGKKISNNLRRPSVGIQHEGVLGENINTEWRIEYPLQHDDIKGIESVGCEKYF